MRRFLVVIPTPSAAEESATAGLVRSDITSTSWQHQRCPVRGRHRIPRYPSPHKWPDRRLHPALSRSQRHCVRDRDQAVAADTAAEWGKPGCDEDSSAASGFGMTRIMELRSNGIALLRLLLQAESAQPWRAPFHFPIPLPRMFHRLGKLVSRQRIENVFLRKPCPPRLKNPVVNLGEVGGVMRIGVDDDLHAMFPCLPEVNVV